MPKKSKDIRKGTGDPGGGGGYKWFIEKLSSLVVASISDLIFNLTIYYI
jgi:hypothetical protein